MLLQWSCDLAVVVFGEYWLFYCGTRRHRLDGKYIEEVMSFVKLIIAVNQYGKAPEKNFYDVNEDGVVDIRDITYLLFSTVYGTNE